MRRFNVSAASAACLSLSMVCAASHAKDEAGEAKTAVLDEVLVTASKRGETSLMDTPMAIQAISAEQLERRGIAQFADYARSISGLAFEDQGPGDKKIVLRGMQSTGAATTGLYFDDIVVTGNNRQDGGGRQPDIRLVDMERIEVLKGPQGTLYGASSMSGTVRMIANKPDPTAFAASAGTGVSSTRYATGENYDFDGMLNVPLVADKLALRVVGYYSDSAGFIDDGLLGLHGVNNELVSGGRAALRWLISDRVTLDVMALYQKTESDGPAWYQPSFGEFVQLNHTSAPWDESMTAFNVALNWELDHGTVTATASLLNRNIFFMFPGTRQLCAFYGSTPSLCFKPDDPVLATFRGSADQPQDRRITASELRYASKWSSPFQVVGGLYYQKEENAFHSSVFDVNAQGERLTSPSNIVNDRIVDGQVVQYAAFGELSYDITDALTATVGARTFRFDVDEVGQNLVTRTRPVAAAPVYTSSTDEDTTLKFNLQYKFASGHMIYATYAEGFRSGGNNEPDFITGTVLPSYKSDSLRSYEVGAKGSFFGGALQLDAAAYYMDWQGLQARVSAGIAGSNALMISNVGAATIEGVEIGAQTRPFESLDLTFGGNVTRLEAELSENGPPGLAGRKGDRIPNVPEFTANVFGEYRFPVSSTWDGSVRADYSYVGDSYSDFNSTLPIYTKQGDYSLANLRLTFERDRYRFTAYANNLFDEQGIVSSSLNALRPLEVIPLRPRTFGIALNYTY